MPKYTYKARNELGKAVHGTMEAKTAEDIALKLRTMSYTPTHIEEAQGLSEIFGGEIGQSFQRIKVEDMLVFNVQLANMIEAGLTVLTSLNTIAGQTQNKKFKETIEDLSRLITAGLSFSEALSHHPRIFSPLFQSMVKAGETSGRLSGVLKHWADYMERQEDLRQKINSALFYPVLLLCVGIAVIILIVSFVIPQFVDIFTKAGIALPLPTRILYGIGIGFKKFWLLILTGAGLAWWGLRSYIRTESGGLNFDQLKLKLPVIGSIIRKVIVARFCRTLATLVESGVPILQSLDILKEVVGNKIIGGAIVNTRQSVEQGNKISETLKTSQEFPPDAVQMIMAGEETGELGPILNKIAEFYESSVGYAVKKLTVLIEPLFIAVMGCMVGFIMASMLLPIFDMMKTLRH